MKTIKQMMAEVREVNHANGWYDTARTFGEDIALLHSEVSEAFEAWRGHGFDDATAHWAYRKGDRGEDLRIDNPKPEGVGSELADLLIRLLDTADRANVDLDAEYERKIAYNRTRGYHHGGKAL